MNMWAGSLGYFVVIILRVLCMAMSSARKEVCNPGSRLDICISGLVAW